MHAYCGNWIRARYHFDPWGDSPDEAWIPQMKYLSDCYRSISYDPRGIGKTILDPAPRDIAEFAKDCADIIEQKCNVH